MCLFFDIFEVYEWCSLVYVVQLFGKQFVQDLWCGVGYCVGQCWLVFDFCEVVEIVLMLLVILVFCVQFWLLGVGNLCGNLFLVVDLKYFLEGMCIVQQEGQCVLIMCQVGGDVVLIIDELFGQCSFELDQQIEVGMLVEGCYGYFVDCVFYVDGYDWGVFLFLLLLCIFEFW